MAIPESQLDTWSKQGSITQSSNTYNSIKRVLESDDSPYSGKNFYVFLQGSYGNDTNIYAESDVDIVIQLQSCFQQNIEALTAQEQAIYRQAFKGGVSYDLKSFKPEVVSCLRNAFGNSVTVDDKAIKISGNGSRRNADVIVSMHYRKYISFLNYTDQQYVEGICFYNSNGDLIANYPKIHLANCINKNRGTNGWFKPTVRVLKNLRNKLIQEKMILSGDAPSYFIEGMLYNVPNDKFGSTYNETIINSINWLLDADSNKLLCANEQFYLLNSSSLVTWRKDKYTAFLHAVRNLWNNW